MLRGQPAERREHPMSFQFGHQHPAATMSLDRLVVWDDNGNDHPPRTMTAPIPTTNPTPTPNSTPNPGASLSRKLPPLIRDNSFPGAGPSAVIAGRSMHQIQLEMEYDAAESDHEGGKGPSIHSWPGGVERHAPAPSDHVDNPAMREVDALCIFDAINLPQSAQPSSPLIDALYRHPSVRRWARWRWRELPAFTSVHIGEAVMIYERGLERATSDRCSRCHAGQGISPHCVVAPDRVRRLQQLESGPCSNCVYDGMAYACNVSGRKTPLSGRGDRTSDADAARGPDPGIDHLAVLEMIAQLKTPSGSRRDLSINARAARIEEAALRIAQAAREWGDKMAHEM